MGTTLTGTRIRDTYDGLIKIDDNQPLNASVVKRLNDGLGNPCPIYLSQDAVEIDNGSFKVGGTLLDGSDAAGSSGQLLSSTGTGVEWVSGGGLTVIESVTHHNFTVGVNPDVYVPINTTAETLSRGVENYIIPIYNGQVARIIMMTSASTTGNAFYMYNGTTLIGNTASKFATTANTAVVVTLSASSFSLGDRINFRYVCDSTGGHDMQISILWEYTRPV